MQTIPSGESLFLTIDLEPGVEYTAVDFSTNSRETFTVSYPVAERVRFAGWRGLVARLLPNPNRPRGQRNRRKERLLVLRQQVRGVRGGEVAASIERRPVDDLVRTLGERPYGAEVRSGTPTRRSASRSAPGGSPHPTARPPGNGARTSPGSP